jgi:hypothetical protein
MTTIDHLNKRLGDDLGRVGEASRFAWKFATEIHYYTRAETAIEFTRHAWSDRLGRVWVIAQFLLPTSFDPTTGRTSIITREQWWTSFHGEFPYPENGMYYAHPETALAIGRLPDEAETAVMSASIRAQMDKPHDAHLRECAESATQAQEDHRAEFMAAAEDSFPAFWSNGQGHEAGKRGAHVSFGGFTQDPATGLYLP